MPMTTQDTAVGRKYTDRKNRHPRTCSFSSAAMASGMPIANGMASSSSALFSSTRHSTGSSSAVV